MDTLAIFGAKYLYLFAVAIAAGYFLLSDRKKEIAIFSILDLAAVYVTGLLGSALYYNPRPFVSEHITPLISHAADNGFPSDHTLLVAALASILYCYNRVLGIVVFAIAILVGASRVFAGIHHSIDIIGSLGIAIAVTLVVYRMARKRFFA